MEACLISGSFLANCLWHYAHFFYCSSDAWRNRLACTAGSSDLLDKQFNPLRMRHRNTSKKMFIFSLCAKYIENKYNQRKKKDILWKFF